jgi:DNA-binding HxlR family transcriptional regulator
MRRLYRPLKYVLGLVLVSFLIPVVVALVNCSLGITKGGQGCSWQAIGSFVIANSSWIALPPLIVIALLLLAWSDKRLYEARGNFALLKSVNKLTPEDLDFQVLEPGEHPAQDKRPFYESKYIPRKAVPYDQRTSTTPDPPYDEEALAQSLREGRKGFLLIGPPTDGKTRTLYEVVKRLEEHVILKPNPEHVVPEDEEFSLLLRGRRVVLLLDDLTKFVDSALDLYEFGRRLGQYDPNWAVASTCRDGPELVTVRQAVGKGVKRFYDDIRQKLSLLPPTTHQKGELAESIGMAWEPMESEQYPTLGSITMEEPMTYMRERFRDPPPEQRDALRALKLLHDAGILPLRQERLRAVMARIFQRIPPHLGDCLHALAEKAFLRPGNQEPVQPEPAYLSGVVTYKEGKNPRDDFAQLADVLEELGDEEGLFYLASTYTNGS